MNYLIDSDWLIDYLADHRAAVDLFEKLIPDGISISVISYMEALEGVEHEGHEQALVRLQALIEGFPLLNVTPSIAERCARLREQLRRGDRRVNQRSLDLLIAATALEHDLTLVTRNLPDYRDIPELKLHPVS